MPDEFKSYFANLAKKIEVEDEVFRIMGHLKGSVGEAGTSKSSD
jgi:hypothetical protein